MHIDSTLAKGLGQTVMRVLAGVSANLIFVNICVSVAFLVSTFLATLVSLHFTPVSKSVSAWALGAGHWALGRVSD